MVGSINVLAGHFWEQINQQSHSHSHFFKMRCYVQQPHRVGHVSGILEAPQDILRQDINKGRDHSKGG